MMYDVSIAPEEADNLVAKILMETFENLSRGILSLRHKPNLSRVDAEDLANDIEIREGIKVVLKYFMVDDDYQDFIEMQRVYGYV